MSTETRWPNVQAEALLERDITLRKYQASFCAFTETECGEIEPTLELALDSLEQKLAERKEGK